MREVFHWGKRASKHATPPPAAVPLPAPTLPTWANDLTEAVSVGYVSWGLGGIGVVVLVWGVNKIRKHFKK